MPRELHLVADTNLFFECKSLSQLPWQELGGDPIIILLTSPLLGEIDKHKKGSGRTRKRALKVFEIVRSMLRSQQSEHVVQEENPRVVLRKAPMIQPDPEHDGALNYSKADDALVGITSTLSKAANNHDVAIITDDTNVAASADHIGLRIELVDESWRREPQQSDDQARIQKLKKDLDSYRQQEPVINCNVVGVDEGTQSVFRTITKAQPLTQEAINDALEALKAKHPIRTDFSVPPDEIHGVESIATLERWSYIAPSDETILKYQNEHYPAWLEKCREILSAMHEGYPKSNEVVTLIFEFNNVGTRPAEDAKIEFTCDGDIAIRRPPDEDDDSAIGTRSPAPLWHRPSFPSPPAAPQVERVVQRAPFVHRPNRGKHVDIGAVLAATNSPGLRLATMLQKQEKLMSPLWAQDSITKGILGSAITNPIGDVFARERELTEKMNARLIPEPSISSIHRPFIPEPHDPETFYFRKWSKGLPETYGKITCDLWRHQQGKIDFEIEVMFAGGGAANGRIVCEVHAGNLTKPLTTTVAVKRTIDEYLFTEDITQMIAEI
ncbi:PIN domain-containing protein [uncultured Ruegeria sp.]|uniref:PIN domain-containing protein n=1 Tax=uncultured Ruegeria sp. TaxID=259304 RepID=UPI002620B75D|nr:PIN domain-containing protein [uncultured Ruegeria sp.]